MEIPNETKIRCPICGEETILKRNKKNSPYWTCTTIMSTVNAHAPMSDEFLAEFVVREDSGEDEDEPDEVATLDGEDAAVSKQETEETDEETIEDLLSQ